MPPKKHEVKPEVKPEIKPEIKPKRTRTMTPDMIEKLRIAREKALEARRMAKANNVDEELIKIRQEIKKEKIGDRVNEIETYKKIKEKVNEEVSKNEIVTMNQKLNDLHGKFEGYLQEKAVRRQQKTKAKEEMTAKEIVKELPLAISQKMLEEELKRQEMMRWRRKYFGV